MIYRAIDHGKNDWIITTTVFFRHLVYIPTRDGRLQGVKPMLINQTSVGNALKALKCKPQNASATIKALDGLAEDLVKKACSSAKANKRKTVIPADIRPLITRELVKDDKKAVKSLKKTQNHVYEARVKSFMEKTPSCRIGGNRLKLSGMAGVFLDTAIEDKTISACSIGGGSINAKILDNLK